MAGYQPYSEYKKSGVEWIGMIPSEWEVKRIKHLATEKLTLFMDGDWIESKDIVYDDSQIRYITTGNIGEGDYKEQGEAYITFEKFSELNCTEIFPGDLVISRLNPPIGRCCTIPDLGSRIVTSVDNVVLRPDERYCKDFLKYAMSSSRYFEFTSVIGRGTTMQRISRGLLGDISLPIANTYSEQQTIARFLDHKTAQIDALIAKKQTLLEKLTEKRTALISHAVTKGLDPNVKMKDSGVEWLGKVPEHWDVIGIKQLTVVKRGASPRPIDDPKYFDDEGEYSWVRIADVSASDRYLESTTQNLSDLGKSLSVPLEPGALFLSIAGTVGKPIITKIKCCIHDGFVYFSTYSGNTEFLYYIFFCGQPYLGLGKMGTQLNLNTDTVGSIRIGFPLVQEQEEIVAFLDAATARLDLQAQKVKDAIEKLTEYRSALITQAVTGKIDVRNGKIPEAAAKGQAE